MVEVSNSADGLGFELIAKKICTLQRERLLDVEEKRVRNVYSQKETKADGKVPVYEPEDVQRNSGY